MSFILPFSDITLKDLPRVGGKNASLGEMIHHLATLGIKVPNGFATTANAYRAFLSENQLDNKIYPLLNTWDASNIAELKFISDEIQQTILNANFSIEFIDAITSAYNQLHLSSTQTVAVRSSATAEDLAEASFAGQQETYLNIEGIDAVLIAIKKVYASLFTERAISYRVHHKFKHEEVAISVGVQQMVRSDCGTSGVLFTIDTETGFDQVIFITASYGLGEMVVKGAVNPDEFYVHKPTLQNSKQSIISRKLGSKKIKMIYAAEQNDCTTIVDVAHADQHQFCLSDQEILQLAKQAILIEKHYQKPMDIEWAKDGITNEIYIIQARPETVKAHQNKQFVEQYTLMQSAKPILSGRSVGQKIGQGVARIIQNPTEKSLFQPGEVLVADMTDPDWEPVMKRASAIITNRGGRTCHAAIIARELGIPAVVGCGNATEIIKNNTEITVSCAQGETGYIYAGKIPYENKKIEVANLPKIPVKLCMNLANPEQAFMYQSIPNDGIGLARIEFMISNMIGIHPNAILHPEKISEETRQKIKEKTSAYASPTEFYIEKLAEGIGTIAAAFYPKPVIVRFSDFKSNEYANLCGGDVFEPHEENPMIGYRGASRYISGDFQPCFALECEAIKRVRNQKGLTNTQIMFPFVRTVAEAKKLIELCASHNLVRGQDDLKMIMMCEIPSNALLPEAFLQYFDGYSIGSNDLTQLTLGIDRDSELVANLFDERNDAVKKLLHDIIHTCKKLNKYVGICGQGPSDHPDLAAWLVEQGIDTLSLTPDSIIKTWMMLGKVSNVSTLLH